MMTCDQFDQRLDEFLDGRLRPEEWPVMESHLAGCAECRARTEAMRAVLADAAALPKAIPPARDLWPAIAARLPERGKVVPLRPASWRRWAPMAAAAVLIIGVTALVTARITRTPAPLAGTPDLPPPGLETFASDREYTLAAEDLERALREGRDQLAPATIEVLERNLALIDAAIAEARAALEADPANLDLRALLLGTQRQKLDLLERATRLTRS